MSGNAGQNGNLPSDAPARPEAIAPPEPSQLRHGAAPAEANRSESLPADATTPVPARKKASLVDLLAELKRRRVFRVMAGYGIFAFAVLQVIEPVLHAFHLADWFLTATVVALAVGFPVAVILSWVFDFTAEGVVRTPRAAGGPRLSRGRVAALLVGVALLAALPGIGWFAWKRSHEAPPVAAAVTVPPVALAPSIAVLAFDDLSEKHDQGYFADGVAEEILNALAHVEGLRVPGRTSSFWFKGKNVEPAEIGRKLAVTHLLEGSVRRSGKRVRVTAQIVNIADGGHLWSETFERSEADIFAVQDEVAKAVTQALRVRLLPGSGRVADGTRTSNPEVYRLYLLGMDQLRAFRAEQNGQALASFAEALALEPTYAAAWAGQAQALYRAASSFDAAPPASMSKGLAAAERAIALAPHSGTGYAVRAMFRRQAYDFAGTRADIARALELEPSSIEALLIQGRQLATEGDPGRALQALRRAAALDPLNVEAWARIGSVLTATGDLAGAREALAKGEVTASSSSIVVFFRGICELASGDPATALHVASRSEQPWARLTISAMALHSLGRAAESRAALDELIANHQFGSAYQVAQVYAWRGERDLAFEWLERARDRQDAGIGMLAYDVTFRPHRDDPRYKAMVRKLKLPVD